MARLIKRATFYLAKNYIQPQFGSPLNHTVLLIMNYL
jgi:hypothetical protein